MAVRPDNNDERLNVACNHRRKRGAGNTKLRERSDSEDQKII